MHDDEEWFTLPDDYTVQITKSGRCRVEYIPQKNKYLNVRCQDGYMGLHRLIYTFFNGPVENHIVINHINGDKSDNRLCNLEAMTYNENTKYWHMLRPHRIAEVKRLLNLGFSKEQISNILECELKYIELAISKS